MAVSGRGTMPKHRDTKDICLDVSTQNPQRVFSFSLKRWTSSEKLVLRVCELNSERNYDEELKNFQRGKLAVYKKLSALP